MPARGCRRGSNRPRRSRSTAARRRRRSRRCEPWTSCGVRPDSGPGSDVDLLDARWCPIAEPLALDVRVAAVVVRVVEPGVDLDQLRLPLKHSHELVDAEDPARCVQLTENGAEE